MLSIGSGNLILSTGHWHYGTWSPLDIDMMGAATGFRPTPKSDQLPWCIGAMHWLQCIGGNALVALVAMHWCNALVAMVVTGQWWEHRPPLNLIDCLAQFQIAGDSNLLWGARVTPTNLTQVRQPLQILLTLIRIWAQPSFTGETIHLGMPRREGKGKLSGSCPLSEYNQGYSYF